MTRYMIVDDEPLAHDLIENFCAQIPLMQLAKNCYDAIEAMQFLHTEQVDLMFLDINMPKIKGFDFLKMLASPPKVIVTTAYQEFALEGYELNIADYLLKPFRFERFVKAVHKALSGEPKTVKVEAAAAVVLPASENTLFFVKGDKKHHQVNSNDILYLEAYGNYTKLYLADEMLLSREKISSFESLLPGNQFLRVHKSFIVATAKIKTIEGNCIYINEHSIPIGQTYRQFVDALLG